MSKLPERAGDIDTWDDPNAHLLDGIGLMKVDRDAMPPLTFEPLVPLCEYEFDDVTGRLCRLPEGHDGGCQP